VLEPEVRQLLLDSLRPPPGYSLSRAVGTTFSLDLHALLIAPLAFALFDTDRDDEPDPLALLEAVRRNADRIDIFCQAGQIALPPRFERVLAYLETSVHQVILDTPRRVFHPKVWVLRFVGTDGDSVYRTLCLTRNLTFARSWDTILSLESSRDSRRGTNGKPLADFVGALPKLAERKLPPDRRRAIAELATEIASLSFLPPPPFNEVGFVPLGIPHHARRSLPLNGSELRLVVSPFLGPGFAQRFATSSPAILVSRAESLDALPVEDLASFEPFVINSDALGPIEDDEEVIEATSESAAERAGCPLRGLHAKLFLAERGREALVWTGSANATAAAFGGNVEFLVELRGHQSTCGLDALMDESGVTFKTVLAPYRRAQEEPTEPSPQEALEERLDALRHVLVEASFVAHVDPRDDNEETFQLRVSAESDLRPDEVDGRLWPISLTESRAQRLADALGGAADFGEVSFDRLTSFLAIELTISEAELSATARFVVNAELHGAPENRGDRLVGRLLDSREKVLRYLLLLLATDGFSADGSGPITRLIDALDHADRWGDPSAVPLLESLVIALAREPDRLDHVARLVESLRATPEHSEHLPEGFLEVWQPIWETRKEAV
jgi:hypothetical protein